MSDDEVSIATSSKTSGKKNQKASPKSSPKRAQKSSPKSNRQKALEDIAEKTSPRKKTGGEEENDSENEETESQKSIEMEKVHEKDVAEVEEEGVERINTSSLLDEVVRFIPKLEPKNAKSFKLVLGVDQMPPSIYLDGDSSRPIKPSGYKNMKFLAFSFGASRNDKLPFYEMSLWQLEEQAKEAFEKCRDEHPEVDFWERECEECGKLLLFIVQFGEVKKADGVYLEFELKPAKCDHKVKIKVQKIEPAMPEIKKRGGKGKGKAKTVEED